MAALMDSTDVNLLSPELMAVTGGNEEHAPLALDWRLAVCVISKRSVH